MRGSEKPADSARHCARTDGIDRNPAARTGPARVVRVPSSYQADRRPLLSGQRVRARPDAGGPMTSTLEDRSAQSRATPAAAVTPRLELDVARALQGYDALVTTLAGTAVHYAVKANPHPSLLRALVLAGSRFDVASQAETGACLSAGADPEDLVFSNPVKRRVDVESAARSG